ncbi:MAG: toprim domain-containing protein [Chitinophagaceae bacterium]
MKKLMITEAKQIDLVEYLSALGHRPQKVRNNDYWYQSPLRTEKTPSFKVNRTRNVWYDHGIGQGGNLIDFGIIYFNCSVSDLLKHLLEYQNPSTSFHQRFSAYHVPASVSSFADEKKEISNEGKIIVLSVKPLVEISLIKYLESRRISLNVANKFCKEIDFLLYGKTRTVIGFQNNAGGYELRSADFKGSSSPKEVAFLDHNKEQLNVFEGFFNFLAYLEINKNVSVHLTNFLILNSLSFFQKERDRMEQHQQIHLFLDRDSAGVKFTQQALQWSKRFVDQSHIYKKCKDLNEFFINQKDQRHKQSHRMGRHL